MPIHQYAFISYARSDMEVVRRIVLALERAGISIWLDTKNIAPGNNFAEAIREAIERATAYVYVASRNSASSKYMELELMAALRAKRSTLSIFPIILDDAGVDGLPAWLRPYQWIDLRESFDAGVQTLVSALSKDVPIQKPIPPGKQKNKGYLFISYSATDRGLLEELKVFLGKHSYGYWDFHESKRDYQTQFHLELEGVIRDSQAVLCIVSPAWKHSRWTPREYLFSEEICKPIFLLKYRPLEPTLLIAGSSYIDLISDKTKGYAELDRELRERGL